MKIALVRGAFLNPFELQLYAPLTKNHEVTAIGADWQVYPHPMAWAGRMERPPLQGGFTHVLHPKAPLFYNRARSWILGASFGLGDLDRCVGRPDILHAAESFFTMTYQCLQIKRKTGCRLVVTVSENLSGSGETHPFRRHRKKEVLKEADLFLAITPTTQKMLLQEGVPERRIAIVPNSIDAQRFKPAAKNPDLMRALDLKADDFVVLFIGRFVREKGLDDILQAIPEILKQRLHSAVRFCFIGEGPWEGRLRAAQRDHPEAVRIHPFVPYHEIHGYHQLADVFIMPSKPGPKINEQFGFVLAESMATAKPVISTRCGSIPDVVGEAGLLIPPSDPVALEKALVQVIASGESRSNLGKIARARVLELFSAEANARKLESLYEGLLHPS